MILKSEHIATLLKEGDKIGEDDPLVISPQPDLEKLHASGSASVDLRLGTWFSSLRQARLSHLTMDEERLRPQLTKSHYVRYGSEYYLHPNSFVLGITLEWIRLPTTMAAYVIGKSSLGRRGLIIATATGVHPGYTGCITLELTNVGEIPIAIKPGMRICQLFFHQVWKSAKNVDCSQFIGRRKPELGNIKSDTIAQKLGDFPIGSDFHR